MLLKASNKYRTIGIYLVLALTTLAAYWQLHTYDFIVYDDPVYVTDNLHTQAGLSRDNIRWAFTTGHASNWHPLTWLSHMLDCQLFGLDARWHHVTSLLLHIASALLLFGVLKSMTGSFWPGFFVAGAFALHPLHVESVAWIAERKDVLSTFFWILTMAAYLRYVRQRGISWYLLTLLAFAFGLMAKPMLVTLPFVLLLLDYWPLNRFESQKAVFYRLVLEKIPFFVLSAASSLITFLVQRASGAVAGTTVISLNTRLANVPVAYLGYIRKMFWPSRLAVFYPHPGKDLAIWQMATAVGLLIVISALVILLARKHKYLLVGWLWFLGTLVPVIGLVQVGAQAMADRYSYIPLTGLFIIIAWGSSELLSRWKYRTPVLGASITVVLLVLSVCTWHQLWYWHDSITLFEHSLKVTRGNIAAYNNLGTALAEQGRFDEAISNYHKTLAFEPECIETHNNIAVALSSQGKFNEAQGYLLEALVIEPNSPAVHNNLGIALAGQGKFKEAISHYSEALQLAPEDAKAHNNIGIALSALGKFEEAVSHYHKALEVNVESPEAYYNLARALTKLNRFEEAVSYFRKTLRFRPDSVEVHYYLAEALQLQGKFDESISHYRQVLQIEPNNANTYNNLGNALLSQDRFEEAIDCFRRAIQLKPDWPLPMNAAAWILAAHPDKRMRNAEMAIKLAERAVELTDNKNATFLNTLAVAYAVGGQFDRAVPTAEKALELALTAKNDKLAEYIRRKLEQYKQKRP